MRYIATIYTDTGHDYIGPDEDLKGVITEAKSVAHNWKSEYPSPVLNIYVSPFDEETSLPDSDADPLWMWSRPVEPERKQVKTKRRSNRSSMGLNSPTSVRRVAG